MSSSTAALAPDEIDGAFRPDDKAKARKRSLRRIPLLLGLAAILGYAGVKGYGYWQDNLLYESTDDAFIDGHVSQVSPQIAGRVTKILVRDNQEVAAGQPLVVIDPRDFEIRLEQAKAQKATAVAQFAQSKAQLGQTKAQFTQATAQLELQKAMIDQAAANLRASEADATQAGLDQQRYSNIMAKAVTRQEVEKAEALAKSTSAKVDAGRQTLLASKAQAEASKAQVEASKASIGASEAQVQAGQAGIDQADAQIANAVQQLSYARLVAPVAGRITKRTVEVGNYVNAGQALLSVVPDEVWITANFKETQVAEMAPGQPVNVYVDAFPKAHFRAHVDSFQTGTGAAFSVLPTENATGNYVKVVQRLPVKIVFDEPADELKRLAPGMSVIPKVKVR